MMIGAAAAWLGEIVMQTVVAELYQEWASNILGRCTSPFQYSVKIFKYF